MGAEAQQALFAASQLGPEYNCIINNLSMLGVSLGKVATWGVGEK